MVFNSITFLLFFVSFFLLYWFVGNKNVKVQNSILLLGSYLFYGWADWRFLFLIIAISALNFYLGIFIEKTLNPKKRQLLVYVGLIQGIGGLAFFKYYNFFVTSINDSIHLLNGNVNLQTLNIIVPLGISFFTFRTISYILDIDNGKIEATKNWVVFLNYVSFFPSVLSGPIDKAKMFIPQLEKKRVYNYSQTVDGYRQILWGLFKKVVIADNCALITNRIFDNYDTLPASSLFIGAFLYTIQIYADFSGYSDMAIGFSRLLGFNVTKNFDFPFFSQNIAEFWRKWHISLTSWLTEYVFTPLSIAFRDYDKIGITMAILINFTIIGIWHGANWTYILFGFLHGCYFIPLILKGTMNKKNKIAKEKFFPSFKSFFNMLLVFILVTLTFIIFRSKTIGNSFEYFQILFSKSLFSLPIKTGLKSYLVIFILLMFVIEWSARDKNYGLERLFFDRPKWFRWMFYYILLVIIFMFAGLNQQFIYFQF
jgi:D-alanyl-lipoteichoic acid acyltransferase DltB (MBOAT superfamily)